MSLIAYYAHVDDAQLQAVRTQPEIVWHISRDPAFKQAALFDIDKDYEVLAWLLSVKKRKEQAQQLASFRAIAREADSGEQYDKAQFARVRAQELDKLGATQEDTNALPTDPALEAIEGRGTQAQRDARINFGMGDARLFTPAEVQKLSTALNAIADTDLRQAFDRRAMDKFEVAGMAWLDENDEVLDQILIPAFHRLRAFYAEAAQRAHYVFVVYQ